jgi:hypothetical protein
VQQEVEQSFISQKMATFVSLAVGTSNPTLGASEQQSNWKLQRKTLCDGLGTVKWPIERESDEIKTKKECQWVGLDAHSSPQTNYADRQPPRPAKSMPHFAVRSFCVVSGTDPYGHLSRFSRPEPLLFSVK